LRPEARLLLDRAERSLDAARLLLSGGFPGWAASRAYYGAFYAAEAFLVERDLSFSVRDVERVVAGRPEAFLVERDLSFSSHSAVIAAFGRHARESGLLADLHRTLLDAFQARNAADYGGEDEATPTEAEQLIERVVAFVDTCNPIPPRRTMSGERDRHLILAGDGAPSRSGTGY